MTINELLDVDPLIAVKLRDDMDFNEIRGEDRELLMKWIEKALMVEATLFLVRNNVIDIVGVKRHDNHGFEPLFRFKMGDEFGVPDESMPED